MSEFHKGDCLGGTTNTCKECRAEVYKNRTPKAPDATAQVKTCFTCKQEKLIEEFAISKINKDGYSGSCKSCCAKKTQKITQQHKQNDPRAFKLNLMVLSARKRTKNTNIPFDITADDLLPFYHQTHCTLIPSIELKWDNELIAKNNSPSLDRIVPALGYVKGNIQIISNLANIMKNNATEEEMKQFIESVRRDALEYFNIGVVSEDM